MKKVYAAVATVLAVCLCCSFFFVFVVAVSSGSTPGLGPGGGDVISYYTEPFQTTNKTTVDIHMGYTPARGVVLFCAYTITNSYGWVIDSSVMVHSPFSPEYTINRKLANLANGKYTFTINALYANGIMRTPEKQTFTVDTSFKYPKLTVISPKNQTYNTNQVDVIYNANSKVTMSYYQLDSQDWTYFNGNTTLSGLSVGSHKLAISVVTEANQHIDQANEAQTIYFNVNTP